MCICCSHNVKFGVSAVSFIPEKAVRIFFYLIQTAIRYNHSSQNTVKFLYQDHLCDCPKVVLKTTFGQSQSWSLIRGTQGVENEEKNNSNFANKVFNR